MIWNFTAKLGKLSKRNKIIISAVSLSLGIFASWFVPVYFAPQYMLALSVISYFFSIWCLWEGLSKVKALLLMVLPMLFTYGVSGYYFQLMYGSFFPSLHTSMRLFILLGMALIYGLFFYTLLLSQNVFNVSSTRTIPLHRAAFSANFVLTLLTSFMLFSFIFSLHLLFILNGVLVFLVSLLLALQLFWSIEMDRVNSLILSYTLIVALTSAELMLGISFWPMYSIMASLVLATNLFVTLGISTHILRERLSRGLVWEYLGWGVFVLIIATVSTSWKG